MGIKLTCCRCKSDMWLPDDLYSAARKSPDISFYCPYGHPQHFPEGETEEVRLRRERDRLKQQLAQKDDEIGWQRNQREAAQRSASARKGQITRLKNRAAAGVCPCCNRSFENLRRHMASKHPGFVSEEII
ncbi:hypothetical protein [Nitratireductor sp. GCM10026969]|uniref:hypothetical protein n=1 Tax=Nitratireductor sp. GCM10026969 TaxID=3252645 RepID=UPI00361C1E59